MPAVNLMGLICEGPDCRGGGQGPSQVFWDHELAQKNPETIPDPAYTFFRTINFVGESHVFCSVKCEHAWQHANPGIPKSPQQLRLQKEAAEKYEAEKAENRKGIHLVETPVSEDPPAPTDPMPTVEEEPPPDVPGGRGLVS